MGYHLCSHKNYERYSAILHSDYPGDQTIDAVYYFLDLTVQTNPNLLIGKVTGKYKIIENSVNSFYLDFATNMTVDSVLYLGSHVNFIHISDQLILDFTTTFNKGDVVDVTVFYNGIPDPSGFGSFIFGSNQGIPSIWTLSQPYGSKDWWPCKDTPGDKADSSDVWLTVNSNLTAVSNGTLVENILHPNGTQTFKWKNSYPISPYLISLAITEYTLYEQYWEYSATNAMPVTHYVYPQNFPALKTQLDKTIPMLDLYSDLFGIYPFYTEKYGHAEFGRLAGMEHQTISSMGAWFDGIIAHELVHQWFGDKLTCADWNNIWLNEGFATYGEALWQEFAYGEQAYKDYIDRLMIDSKRATGTIYVYDVSSVANIFNPFRSYAKGAIVLYMLRGVVGDEVFFNILKTYANDPAFAYGTVVTSDFKNVCESVSGMNLEYFFNQWIYGENYPKYIVDWNYRNTEGVNYEIDLTISQQVNSLPSFFTMPVEMRIKTDLTDTLITFFNDSQSQLFRFTLPGKPQSVTVDPNNKILKDVSGNIFNVPVSYKLEQNYPNPFNPTTKIFFEIGRVSNVQIIVYDILGREVNTLVNDKYREGRFEIEFNASGLSSGVYMYKIIATPEDGDFEVYSDTKSMVFLK